MSSRFNFKPMSPISTVIAAEGKHYKAEFEVPTPVGKYWGDMALDLLKIVDEFGSRMDDPKDRAKATVEAFEALRGQKRFWKELLPAVLGIKRGSKDEKGFQLYLEEWLTNVEIVNVFMEASAAIVNYSFGMDETKEALEKSEGGGVAEEEDSLLILDGSTQPA